MASGARRRSSADYDAIKTAAEKSLPLDDPSFAEAAAPDQDDRARGSAARRSRLSTQLENRVNSRTQRVEQNEHTLRRWTIALGLAAVMLGLVMTLWVVITLRPLRRLRDAARRVAAGDYG